MNTGMTGALPDRRVHFCYLEPKGFSGQRAATELVIKGLTQRGWRCERLPQPVLDRETGGRWTLPKYLFGVLGAWIRAWRLVTARGDWFCVNLPQTRNGFLLYVVPMVLGRIFVGRSRMIVSLHGSLFMKWRAASFEGRIFRFLLNQAATVTVLGERQKKKLIALGLPQERVAVVVNSCELEVISTEALSLKLERRWEETRPVRLLYFSSLIDTKGFPEYLESIELLARENERPIEAVLCGRLVASEFSARFAGTEASQAWIEQKINGINASARTRVRWVRGAVGDAKAALFREADIFVLPTKYAVEAQPLVLLEAMASGCAIITTGIGEIPTILDGTCALFLEETSVVTLAKALGELSEETWRRTWLARAARDRFVEQYRIDRHIDRWEGLLQNQPETLA